MKRTFAVALTGAALVLSGCGGGSDSSNSSSTGAGSGSGSGSGVGSGTGSGVAAAFSRKSSCRRRVIGPTSSVRANETPCCCEGAGGAARPGAVATGGGTTCSTAGVRAAMQVEDARAGACPTLVLT